MGRLRVLFYELKDVFKHKVFRQNTFFKFVADLTGGIFDPSDESSLVELENL